MNKFLEKILIGVLFLVMVLCWLIIVGAAVKEANAQSVKSTASVNVIGPDTYCETIATIDMAAMICETKKIASCCKRLEDKNND